MRGATIDVELGAPPEQVAATLRALVEPARLVRPPAQGAGARALVGRVHARTFTARLNTGYRNPFGAICHGELVPCDGGTRVRATIRPSALPWLAVTLWCAALASIAFGRVRAAGVSAGSAVLPLVLPALLMAVGALALAALGWGLARGEGERLALALRAALGGVRPASARPGVERRKRKRKRSPRSR